MAIHPIHSLGYHKTKIVDLTHFPYPYPHLLSDKPESKTLADSITDPQLYIPIYKQLFELNETNYNTISLNHFLHVKTCKEVVSASQQTTSADVFIKFSPLLDPIKFMVGKYDLSNPTTRTLPRLTSTSETSNEKILDHSNASYVDGFFYYLSSILKNHHGFQHGIDFYGTYLGIQDRFKINIEDDLDYLSESPFFLNNIGKIMVLENFNQEMYKTNHNGSRGCHPKLNIQDMDSETMELGIQDISESSSDGLADTSNTSIMDVIYDKPDSTPSNDDDYSDDSDETPSENGTDESEEDEDQDDDQDDEYSTVSEDSENEEDETIAYIYDFPVQMIFMEKCDGTMDELFVKSLPEEEAKSALFQVIMILLTYQKMFRFTHNDLHTNNIMYKKTDQEFLYYRYQNVLYKIPTYGRIFKIIDYGRSIFKYQKQTFCSDSFAPGGDADTQYNCEPYMRTNKPRLEPNMSFDLCRLGCSIFDFLFKNPDDEADTELKRIIKQWCTDDNDKNVLYKKYGNERYPGFKLYKMIARTVHKHVPEAQLTDPFFQEYVCDVNTPLEGIMSIDDYPDYS
jgi:hypothetical protein